MSAEGQGIPFKILNEAVGTVVTLELDSGDVFTGQLKSVENTMNVQLTDVKKTSSKGKVSEAKAVYLRGSNVVFFQLPDALMTSPAVVAAQTLLTASTDKRGAPSEKADKGFGGGRLGKKRPREETNEA